VYLDGVEPGGEVVEELLPGVQADEQAAHAVVEAAAALGHLVPPVAQRVEKRPSDRERVFLRRLHKTHNG